MHLGSQSRLCSSRLVFSLGEQLLLQASISSRNRLASGLSSLALSDSGLTMTLSRNGGALFGIFDLSPSGPPSWGSRSLDPFQAGGPPGAFVADFSSPIAFFQMEFGDYNLDADTFVMNAYSGLGGTGTLLGTFTMFWPASNTFPDDVGIGSISAAGIQSVVFTSSGIFGISTTLCSTTTSSPDRPPACLREARLQFSSASVSRGSPCCSDSCGGATRGC